jgi:predicted dehydrogenase
MKLRIGVVGAGRIAKESHLPVLKGIRKVSVVAICDTMISAARDAASQFGIKGVYDDLEEMLKKENLDVVDICTPPQTHASLSIKAMEAGLHVLVEKPMATSVQQADEMINASKKNAVKLCVVHQNLCNSAVMEAKRLVQNGEVGDLLNVIALTLERKDSELCLNENHWCHMLPGGIFYEILPHPVYLLQSFLKNVEPIFVFSRKLGNLRWMKNDEVRVFMNGKNGIGSLIASCNSSLHGDFLYILGTRLALEVDLWGRILIRYKPRAISPLGVGMSNLYLSSQLFKMIGNTLSISLKALQGKASAHYSFISRFFDSLFEDSEPPATGEDGRENVKILEKICNQLN